MKEEYIKKEYIRQVKKELHIPRKVKREVLRDLDEIFASAHEHGETERQVTERLGTPGEFAENIAEQLDIDMATARRQKGLICSMMAFLTAAVAFVTYGVTKGGEPRPGSIGQADAMTNIQIEGACGVDLSVFLLGVGIAAVAVAVVSMVIIIGKSRGNGI